MGLIQMLCIGRVLIIQLILCCLKLISWRSQEDPAMGFYKFVLDLGGPSGNTRYLIYWNNSKLFWTNPEWDEKSNTFPSAPETRINYSYISNANESYFTYSLYNSAIMSRLVVDISGQVKQFICSERMKNWYVDWVEPERSCDVYGICGPFGNCNQDTQKCECLPGFVPRYPTEWALHDASGGCVRRTPLHCGSKDGFSPIPTSKLPDKPQLSPEIYNSEECKSACEATCSCNAYAFDRHCQLRDGDIINMSNITSSRYASAVF
ncbi:hypothetical protein MKX03_002578 [Papaver bracteatum]|nr:hypothetical protein MKX03_002578 [Papaver bracteatum]